MSLCHRFFALAVFLGTVANAPLSAEGVPRAPRVELCDPSVALPTPCFFDGSDYVPFGKIDPARRSFSLNLSQSIGGTYLTPSDDQVSGTGGSYSLHTLIIPSDDVATGGGTGGGTVQGLLIDHRYGGENARGTRQTLQVNSYLIATDTPDLSYTNRNYVAGVFRGLSMVPSAGRAGAPLGAVFGINPVAELRPGAVNFLNAAAIEANVGVASPAEAPLIRAGIALVGFGAGQGSQLDAAIDVSAFAASVGFKTGISFNALHGGPALDAGGTVLSGSGTVANGIDLSGFSISGLAFTSPGFTISGSGQVASTSSIAAANLVAANQDNVVGAGGAIDFRTATGVAALPMASVKGFLGKAMEGELQGSLVFATRPIGSAGQSLHDRMIVCHNGAVGIGNTACSYKLEVTGTTKLGKLNVTLGTPLSSSANCSRGDQIADENYVYVCIAPNTWKRAALASW